MKREQLVELAKQYKLKNVAGKNMTTLADELEKLNVDVSAFRNKRQAKASRKSTSKSPSNRKVTKKETLLDLAKQNNVEVVKNNKIAEICELLRKRNVVHEFCEGTPIRRGRKSSSPSRISPKQAIDEIKRKTNVVQSPRTRKNEKKVAEEWSEKEWSDEEWAEEKPKATRKAKSATRKAKSPATRKAKSPATRKAKSATRKAKSPATRKAKSATRKAKSPATRKAKSPATRKAKSPATRKAKSPATRKAKSPATRKAKSPATRKAKSPATRKAKSPATRKK